MLAPQRTGGLYTKSAYQNRKIKIGITEAEIRIEAKQLTGEIVTALLSAVISPFRHVQPWIKLCVVMVELR